MNLQLFGQCYATAQCITTGAAHLDHYEPGWEAKINLNELDMAASCHCIIGQLEDDYTEGYLGWIRQGKVPVGSYDCGHWARRHGFFVAGGYNDAGWDLWDLLDAGWTALIKHRYDTGALSN